MGRPHSTRNKFKFFFLILLLISTIFSLSTNIYFFKLNHYLLIPNTLFSLFIISVLYSVFFSKLRIITANFSVLIALLLSIESGFFLKSHIFSQDKNLGTYSYHFFESDPELGYKISAGPKTYTSIRTINKKIIYDVSYTIDKNGFRLTPKSQSNRACIWFLGDSFTFGEGLKNEESLPWIWAEEKKVNTRNFAVPGYGPHQILRFLELSHSYDHNDCKPDFIFLQLIPSHILRTLGNSSWDKNGPWYDIDNEGNLFLKGKFSDQVNKPKNIYLQKSYLVRYIESKITPPAFVTEHDWKVYKKIIQNIYTQSHKLNAKVVLLFWDIDISNKPLTYTEESKKILDDLNIDYVLASSLLGPKVEHYFIKGDGHPNAEGFKTVASKFN